MEQQYTRGVTSTAAIGKHPLHPLMVPFPVAFLCGALATDLASRATGDPFWGRASFWLIAAGLVTGVLAAVLGLVDFLTIQRARSLLAGWVHFLGNGVVLALAGVSLGTRWQDPGAPVSGLGISLSALITALLVLTGWLGGELSYRHKIGVIEEESAARAAVEVGQRDAL